MAFWNRLAAVLVLETGLVVGAAAADFIVPESPVPEGRAQSGIVFGKNSDYWEFRLGGGAYDWGPATPSDFTGGTVNLEFLTPSPDFLSFIGSPRPIIGADLAISDNAIQVVYAGLNWEAYLTRKFYIGFSGGGSWNSSPQTGVPGGAYKDLGSEWLFFLQASIGYDITANTTIQIYYNHFSNANIDDSNPGLESVGARLGYRF
jgi:lipid A 3-O-deacylase